MLINKFINKLLINLVTRLITYHLRPHAVIANGRRQGAVRLAFFDFFDFLSANSK